MRTRLESYATFIGLRCPVLGFIALRWASLPSVGRRRASVGFCIAGGFFFFICSLKTIVISIKHERKLYKNSPMAQTTRLSRRMGPFSRRATTTAAPASVSVV